MATITPTLTSLIGGRLHKFTWTGITESDTCAAIGLLGWKPMAAQITGTFGSSTTVMQGSIDGTNYYTLVDGGGSNWSKTSAGAQSLRDNTYLIRPSASGGTGQSTIVTLLVRREF